jgi:O-antigen/teichoic acid export membrane protein
VTDADAPPSAPRRGERSFGLDVLLTAGSKVLFVLSTALVVVIVARALGPEGQGRFAVAFTLTLLLVQLGSIGLPIANPYFAARHPEQQGALARLSLLLALLLAAALALGTAVINHLIPDLLQGLTRLQLAITLGAIPAALASLYLQGVLLGQRRMLPYNAVELTQVASTLIALVIAFGVASPGLTLVLLIIAGSRYVALLVGLWSLRGLLMMRAPQLPGLARRVLGHGSRVYVVGLLSFALIRIDLLLVNALLGAHDAGQYSIAAYIAEALSILPIVVGTNLVPRVAVATDNGMTATVVRVLAPLWATLCVASIPVVAITVPLIFGDSYRDAVPLYLWLVVGLYSTGMLNALVTHYLVRGYSRGLIAAWGGALVGNIVLNVALLPVMGVVAAPILSTVAYTAVLLAHLRAFAGEVGGYRTLRPTRGETVGLLRAAFANR